MNKKTLFLFIFLQFLYSCELITIKKQGMFSTWGSVLNSDGVFDVTNYYKSRTDSTLHVDHANVFYKIPKHDTGLPMVFLHGYGQSRIGWITTPDGREGWSDMFLRTGYSVFLIDQPRRDEAGQTSQAGTISTTPSDKHGILNFVLELLLMELLLIMKIHNFLKEKMSLTNFLDKWHLIQEWLSQWRPKYW